MDEVRLVPIDRSEGVRDVVVLTPVRPGITPDHCVHGRTTCAWCNDWCWLGDASHDWVSAGLVVPICMPCADLYLPPDKRRVGNLGDHKRADGPH